MIKKKLKKESIRDCYRVFEYDDGSFEEILDATLIEDNRTEEEKSIYQEQLEIMNYSALSKSDKHNLSVESQLKYISTLLEHLVSKMI